MKQLDLFAGIGGISLAAEWADIETVAFCEKEPFAQSVLRRRFPGRPIYDDVYNLTREVLENDGITGIDIVAGGFPCQPLSHAGKRKGTGDDRYLWPEMCRIIGEIRPSWVFAENVDGLVSMAQSDWNLVMEDETTICEEAETVLETIRKDLEAIGYRAIPIIIPACGVGASHRRYRIFIVGYTEHDGSHGATVGRGADSPSYNESERTHETGELAGASGRTDDATLTNPTCERSHGQRREGGWRAEPSNSGETLAHSPGERRGKTRGYQPGGTAQRIAFSGQDVADSGGAGCEECHAATFASGSRYHPRSSDAGGPYRATQSGVGGSPYELSDWLDGFGMNPLDALINFISAYPQPALMGQEQHAWEPPRVATGVKNRSARLKALGNAVNPLQALPILYGIRVNHEFLSNKRGAQI